MAKILVVEDDPGVREVVEHAVSREGMEAEMVHDGEAALERLRSPEPLDLVILDLMLPGVDGISVLRQIREDTPHRHVPVIILTARGEETDVVVGLEVGADDYVTKPFRPRELVGRIRAHLRRKRFYAAPGGAEHSKLEFPGLEIDVPSREVVLEGEPVELTAKEFDILVLLAEHPGRVYSREQIMRHLWGGEFFGEERAADVHVRNIRKKIEPNPQAPRYVQTMRGAGYRFAQL